jgi:hypothetical protein
MTMCGHANLRGAHNRKPCRSRTDPFTSIYEVSLSADEAIPPAAEPLDLPLFRMKDDRPGQTLLVYRPCSTRCPMPAWPDRGVGQPELTASVSDRVVMREPAVAGEAILSPP